ncbi:MAG: hypothetical protein QME83_06165, partial [Thermodesulfobacteriota bacterium]|nr:hypothetical protein [Thermodesulfobacteriota bacterium]
YQMLLFLQLTFTIIRHEPGEGNGRFIKLLMPLSEICPPFCNFLISLQFLKVNKKIFATFRE